MASNEAMIKNSITYETKPSIEDDSAEDEVSATTTTMEIRPRRRQGRNPRIFLAWTALFIGIVVGVVFIVIHTTDLGQRRQSSSSSSSSSNQSNNSDETNSEETNREWNASTILLFSEPPASTATTPPPITKNPTAAAVVAKSAPPPPPQSAPSRPSAGATEDDDDEVRAPKPQQQPLIAPPASNATTQKPVTPPTRAPVATTPVPSTAPTGAPNVVRIEEANTTTSAPLLVVSTAPTTKSTNATNTTIAGPMPSPRTRQPTVPPTPPPVTKATYFPGELTVQMEGLILSQGLTARRIATTGRRVDYNSDGTEKSDIAFHWFPDAGATFADPRADNVGGWIYVSNSEVDATKVDFDIGEFPGGVGALTFNAAGAILEYQMVLDQTRMNCGGGRTPWHTWVSCEETTGGRIYHVDPTGRRAPEPVTLGDPDDTLAGKFESFAYDDRDRMQPRFFVTKDEEAGELRRFTPNNPDWNDPWSILNGDGTMDFLDIDMTSDNAGTFQWVSDASVGANSARRNFPNSEGIDCKDGLLYFISKTIKTMFILTLDAGTFTSHSTVRGLFDGQSDQIGYIVNDNSDDFILYFTEDGGTRAGIHGRNKAGQFFTILESDEYPDETTGLSFSPDSKHMYIAYQDNGFLFDIERTDGLPFDARTLNVKYHATDR